MKHFFSLIKTFLLVCVTLAYISGIVLSKYLPLFSPPLHILSVAVFSSILFTYIKKNNTARITLLITSLLFGYFIASNELHPPKNSNHIYTIIQKQNDLVIIGHLKEMVKQYPDHTRLLIATTGYSTKTSIQFQPATGLISVRLKGPWQKEILPGDTVIMRITLSLPKPASTPGTFDYRNFLANQDIWVTGKLRSPLLLEKIHNEQTFLHKVKFYPEQIRARFNNFITSNSSPETHGLYNAILTGNKSLLPANIIEGFKTAGAMHILAISGLHLSILAAFLYSLFYWICARSERFILAINIRKTAALLTTLPLSFYALLAGGNAPVIRSLIMALTVTIALCSDKKKSISTTVAFAAFLILLLDPLALFTSSFQLSFSAVIFILAGATMFKQEAGLDKSVMHKIIQWVKLGLLVSFSATAGVAPLLFYYFNRIALPGPITNLILEPLICFWSLPVGFLSLAIQFLSPDLAAYVLKIGGLGLFASIKIITFIQNLPIELSLWRPSPSPAAICLYYVLFALLFFFHQRGLKLWRTVTILLFFTACFFIWSTTTLFSSSTNESTIVCFDVGQGSSTLIVTPEQKTILIDAGGGYSPSFNVGERVIAPYLWHMGIKKIDHIIITHPDSDHYNGLYFLMKHFSPDHLWLSSIVDDSWGYTSLIQLAVESDVVIHKNQIFSPLIFKQSHLDWYFDDTSYMTDNDSGLIIRYVHGKFSMLFPGDIGKEREYELASKDVSLNSTILLAPHHGSRSSNSSCFIKKAAPEQVVISSGKSKYFPAVEVLNRYEQLSIPVHLTRQAGTIIIETDGEEYAIQHTLPSPTILQ